MFTIKKIGQVWLALGIALSILAMPAYAEENLNQSVKDMYEQPESSTTNEKKVDSKIEENAETTKNVGLSFLGFFTNDFRYDFCSSPALFCSSFYR